MVNYDCVCSVASLALELLCPKTRREKLRFRRKKNSLISRYCTSYSSHKTSATKEAIIVCWTAADEQRGILMEFHSIIERKQTSELNSRRQASKNRARRRHDEWKITKDESA